MADGPWWELRLRVPVAWSDRVGAALLELGAEGLQEDHPGLHFPDDSGPLIPGGWHLPEAHNPDPDVLLIGWFPPAADVAAAKASLADRLAGWGLAAEPQAQPVQDQDWSAEWKRHWTATPLSPRILVVPTWLDVPAHGPQTRVLRIDPGLAFGTGTHETTAGCMALADAWLRDHPARGCLDVGTGTGILALGALALGVPAALGVDVDPQAVSAAAVNAEVNGLRDRLTLRVGGVEAAPGRWDLVFANLLAPLLVQLAAALAERVADGGALITSGLLLDQEPQVDAALSAAGLTRAEAIGDVWRAQRWTR